MNVRMDEFALDQRLYAECRVPLKLIEVKCQRFVKSYN